MRKIVLLGASGSIGLQTIDVCLKHSEEFKIVALSVGKNIEVLRDILSKIEVSHVCVQTYNESLIKEYPHIQFYFEDQGLIDLVNVECDVVVNALVGFVGVKPTLEAIKLNKEIALANKETLVVAGEFVMAEAKKHNVSVLPIDSEHSAIFQALQGNKISEIRKLIITASGGSFRDKTRDELKGVSVSDALNHPNWAMGAKITIDSATMMNKGFEVIEAHWLFGVDYDQIDVLMHPQSIVHSLVEYQDGSQMAQLGLSDMRLPIQYALSYPARLTLETENLDLAKIGTLTFKALDFNRFPLLKVAYEAGRALGNAPCILNAANEVANAAFLKGEIEFLAIEFYIMDALKHLEYCKEVSLQDIFDCDLNTRSYVRERINVDAYNN
ncbi:MAG: 1-deoxy-D-xylulose-5-phosphate reductoisomerase [Erysipelotrichaceae bacterium]